MMAVVLGARVVRRGLSLAGLCAVLGGSACSHTNNRAPRAEAPLTQRPQDAREPSPVNAPTPSPPTALAAACPPSSDLLTACRSVLAEFAPTDCTRPRDCTVSPVAEAHGVRVHLLRLEQFLCDRECTERGLLGEPLGREFDEACAAPTTESSSRDTLLVEYAGQLWPLAVLESFRRTWDQQETRVEQLAIADAAHVVWSQSTLRTHEIEPDAGAGGRITQEANVWNAIYLGERGPELRHSLESFARTQDDSYPVRLEDESDADFAAREQEANEARSLARETAANTVPATPPPLDSLRTCSRGAACPAACDADPSP